MKLNPQILLYKKNSKAYSLILWALVANTYSLLNMIDAMDKDVKVGVVIFVNIFLSLAFFLIAVNVNTYSILWSYIAIVFGVVQLVRAIWFIPDYFVGEEQVISLLKMITDLVRINWSWSVDLYLFHFILLIVSALLSFAGGYIGVKYTRQRNKEMNKAGNLDALAS